MAPSATANSPNSPTSPPTDISENNLQPFFVLREATSSHNKSNERPNKTPKTRRRIDLSPSKNKETEKPEGESDDHEFVHQRMEAFELIWSKIESTIKDVLRDLNTSVFDEIYRWIRESFNSIKSCGEPSFLEATQSFPAAKDVTSKKLFTGLVLTKNLEFADDLLTFKELGLHLKSQGCYLANLSSLDFSVKNGIGGCLRSLLRQLVMVTLDAPDISILATWYREQGDCTNPVVIIIDDLERCCGSVLSDFIIMLCEWVLKIPVILIMGVATTLDAVRNILPANMLHHLCPCKFIFGTPSERMDAIVEAVLVKQCSGFSIGHKVAVFLRNYFVSHDGTLTSFIRALKIACAQHFSMEPLSFMLLWFLEEDNKVLHGENYGLSPENMCKHAFELPSCLRKKMVEQNGDTLVHGLSELKKLCSQWSNIVMCLYEAGKCDKVRLLDLFCEALDPESDMSRVCNAQKGLQKDIVVSPRTQDMHVKNPSLQKDGFIGCALRKVRDLPAKQLYTVLKGWEKHSADNPQIQEKVKELLSTLKFEDISTLKFEDSKNVKHDVIDLSKRNASRSHLHFKDSKVANEKAVRLAEYMIRNHLQPVECIPFHEIICFKSVDNLQAALLGHPRRRIQVDLLEFHNIIHCSCCRRSGNSLLPSVHDSSIMYSLAQEHGDLVNLHDWYQSFKSVILSSSNKGKHRSKHSPSPKKRKVTTETAKPSEASIQARFCRAVTELQITGLIRMPGKRRPDYVQRVAFGL
ncbi:origin of replication complex subunit 3 isoform X1 [Ricinus communis]|uniref:origin of replication complex subunit 3 isoform X1 n=1 Tax=Ricinus communis TaxID=3988 RepID=UPI00201AD72D|nr:origin of replication complex subunit 3 isoform X1 [Ricinus communis]